MPKQTQSYIDLILDETEDVEVDIREWQDLEKEHQQVIEEKFRYEQGYYDSFIDQIPQKTLKALNKAMAGK